MSAVAAPGGCPRVPMLGLDTVWMQVAGTICNLRCTHCFISCAPDNHSHEMMTLEQVRGVLREAAELGVREYYFTGGEPFMHRDLMTMLRETLAQGPAGVLTNGLFLDRDRCRSLRSLADESEYSLDIRVSLDGWGEEDHDAIRGQRTFRRTVDGIGALVGAGLNPVITVTEAARGVSGPQGRQAFLDVLRSLGLTRPRLKVLPLWRLGAETMRSGDYRPWERLSSETVTREGIEALQCSTGRMVTSRGVYVCPILIDAPAARMGATLRASLTSFELSHPACHTCYVTGATCRS